ncbi:VC0807 family protein [Spirobacillus cienkowskii]|uniref:VC0807 family protein n=1 Tax=Spirobacillus cienkowskii TaxID=495820 RepID=UPI0030D3509B
MEQSNTHKNSVITDSYNKAPKTQENLWASIIFYVALPVLVLSKLNTSLGPLKTLLLALAIPLCYGIYDFSKRKQASPIAILGIVSIFIKGIFAFYKVDGFWFAVQEASIPTFLGVFTIVSAWIGKPFVNYFVYNENIFKIDLLENKLKENKAESQFKSLMWQVTMVFGFAFFLSGLLNYILAIQIIVSPAGTESFNKELAEMTWKSYIVIALPKFLISIFGLWWFIFNLKKLTGLKASEILKGG